MPNDHLTTPIITYIAPDPQVISDFTRKIYSEFETKEKNNVKDNVHAGFSTFLSFVAIKLTKYLNEGHTELLNEFNTKSIKKGGSTCHKKPQIQEQ
jgi:hypothetical protein